jgi:hypothetical protein
MASNRPVCLPKIQIRHIQSYWNIHGTERSFERRQTSFVEELGSGTRKKTAGSSPAWVHNICGMLAVVASQNEQHPTLLFTNGRFVNSKVGLVFKKSIL